MKWKASIRNLLNAAIANATRNVAILIVGRGVDPDKQNLGASTQGTVSGFTSEAHEADLVSNQSRVVRD